MLYPSYKAPKLDVAADKGIFTSQIWTAVEGENLFTDNNGGRWKSAMPHMARMVSLLGPPPQSLLDRSEETKKFFNKNGTLSTTKFDALNCKVRWIMHMWLLRFLD